ncbi:MAG: TonB-dependent receptor [Bacteroidia bacterium]
MYHSAPFARLLHRTIRLALMSCLLWPPLLAGQPSPAQQDSTANTTDTTRWEQAIFITTRRGAGGYLSSPETFSLLDSEQLQIYRGRSTPEALMGVPGVWMQKTNHGGGSPFVRGLTGNQTLLLVDGIRLNNSTYRYGPNQYLNTIDPLTLDRVEVLRGAGSVQYGSDALGGAVNLLTRTPDFGSEGLQAGGEGYFKAMSADMEQSGRAALRLASPRMAVLAGASYKNFGDLLAGGDLGVQAPSAYREFDADIKARIRTGERHSLTLAAQWVDQRGAGRFDQVAQRGYAVHKFDPQQRLLTYARWEAQPASRWATNLRLTVSGQSSVEGRVFRRATDTRTSHERDVVRTLGATAEVQSQPAPRWTANTGIEWYYDLVNSRAFRIDSATGTREDLRGLYPDGSTAVNLAAFSLHAYELPRWSFTGGLRYNLYRLQISDATFGSIYLVPQALVGQASAAYKPAPRQRITAAVNTGFRAPNINDLSSFGSFDSGIEVPTAALDAERTLSGELSYKVAAGRVELQAAAFYTRLSNLIDRVPATYLGDTLYDGQRVYTKANVDAAFIAGTEVDGQLYLGSSWRVLASVIYAYGQTQTGQPLRRIPPLNGRLGLHYADPSGVFVRAEWLWATLQDRLAPGDISDHRIPAGGTPGWQVVNGYAGYTWRFVQLNLGLQNIFNEAYRTHGSGVDGYGRSLWLSVQVAW